MKIAALAKLPVVLTFSAGAAFACSDADHPPPVSRGGGDGIPTPVITDFGGASNAGTRGGTDTDGAGIDTFAGSRNTGGDSSFGGSASSFGGAAASFGGTVSSFGGTSVAGDTSTGASFSFGGSIGFAGTPSSFSTGGI